MVGIRIAPRTLGGGYVGVRGQGATLVGMLVKRRIEDKYKGVGTWNSSNVETRKFKKS